MDINLIYLFGSSFRVFCYFLLSLLLVADVERKPKRLKNIGIETDQVDQTTAPSSSKYRIAVVTMAGVAINIDDAAGTNTILSVKHRVFAAHRNMYVVRQRLVYQPGPHGMDPLADNETLGGAGVAEDGSAKLDVLLADLSEVRKDELGFMVRLYCYVSVHIFYEYVVYLCKCSAEFRMQKYSHLLLFCVFI